MHVGVNLLVLTEKPPGGTGYHAISLFEALVDKTDTDLSGDCVTGFAAEHAACYFSPGARRRLKLLPRGPGWRRIVNEAAALPMAARRLGIDVMVNPAFLGVPWGSRRRALIIHDLYFKSDPALVPPKRRLLLNAVVPHLGRASDIIFAVSGATRTEIMTYYPSLGSKTKVLHSGNRVLLRSDAPPPARPIDGPYLLMVGHLTANKLPETVVAALASLHQRGYKMQLVHLGDDGGRLGPLAAAAGASDSVLALGHQPDEALGAYYAHCEALVIPSIREGFGLPLLEAQAHGAPVIASNCAALREIGGDSALFFPVASAEACAQAVSALLVDPDLRRDLIARGSANAAGFRWERTAEQLMEALHAEGATT